MSAIIVLRGKPSSGKSTAMGVLYDSIIMSDATYSIVQDRKRRNSKDFFVIVEKNGKRIGITAYGDSAAIIKKLFDYFLREKCEVIIGACRATGPTKDKVRSYLPSPLIEIDKRSGSTLAERNRLDKAAADELFNELESLI